MKHYWDRERSGTEGNHSLVRHPPRKRSTPYEECERTAITVGLVRHPPAASPTGPPQEAIRKPHIISHILRALILKTINTDNKNGSRRWLCTLGNYISLRHIKSIFKKYYLFYFFLQRLFVYPARSQNVKWSKSFLLCSDDILPFSFFHVSPLSSDWEKKK